MKKILLTLSVLVFSFMATTQVAHAKKFGGGGSFGFSKKMPPKQFNQNKQKQQKAAPAGQTAGANGKAGAAGAAGGAAASGASRWMGPLAGLAAGGLLAAMIFGDGFEGLQLFDILLFALIAFILFQFFKRRSSANAPLPQQSQYQQRENAQNPYQQAHTQAREAAPQQEAYNPNASGSIFGSALGQDASQGEHTDAAPEWFDANEFIGGAKGHFVSVQKAWDALDLSEIQAYCTPELYEALQGEIAQIEQGANVTIVEDLEAEVADMTNDGDYFIVSVRFSGFIKEEQFGDGHAFNENWYIRHLANNEGDWQIAGIQQ